MALRPGDLLGALRARLRLAGAGPVDVVVTHCEVNDRHGTGVLLRRLFGAGDGIVTVRSRDLYGGAQRFGRRSAKLKHPTGDEADVARRIGLALGGLRVGRILCAPYYPDDVRTALGLARATGAPVATWLLDDQNVHVRAIPDELMGALLRGSALRLAVSPELGAAYEGKFGVPMALAPPVAPADHILQTPASPDAGRVARRHGLLLGNVWGQDWLDLLLGALSGSGVSLDWPTMGGTPWRRDDPARLEGAGIRPVPFLPEVGLVGALRASPFVVVPTGTLERGDSHGALARLSLPSRIPFTAATSGTPLLVLGSPETAAARFVQRHGLGRVVPYDRGAFAAAVEAVLAPEAQRAHREAAARIAPALSSAGMAGWLWDSLAAGRPADDRFGALEPHRGG